MKEPLPPTNGVLPLLPGGFDQLRQARGWLLAQNPERRVKRLEETAFLVPSEHEPGVLRDVFVDGDGQWICTPCDDLAACYGIQWCKHIFEVLYRYFPTIAPPVPYDILEKILKKAPADKQWYADARRNVREPYPYTEGFAESTREDHGYEDQDDRILELLTDLAKKLDSRHPQNLVGRPTLSPGEKVLILVRRKYERKSMRVFRSALKRLQSEGIIRFAPRRTTLVKYNTSEETIQLLLEALDIVTRVFRLLEVHVISDSSGFSPLYVSNWLDSNYGATNYRNGTEWFKLHLFIGRESKAILGFAFTPARGDGVGDSSMLVPMTIDLRRRDFSLVDTLIVDNGYLTPDNINQFKPTRIRLVAPFKGRNLDKETKVPRESFIDLAEFAKSDKKVYRDLTRARQAIEAIFSNEKRIDNHIEAIGTESEREEHRKLLVAAQCARSKDEHKKLADAAAAAGLYRSRVVDFLLRVICQVLRRTVIMEHKWNRVGLISYTRDSVFGRVREYSEEPPSAA